MSVLGKDGIPQTGIFTQEQIFRMIEIGDSDSFFDVATAAIDAAQSENEDMYEKMEADPPSKLQAHILHWNEHFQFIQGADFNDTSNVPQDIREAFFTHLAGHEYFMYMQAIASLTFAQELMKIVYFPCCLTIGPLSGLPELKQTIVQIVNAHLMPPPLPPMPEEEAPEEEAPVEQI
jgi:hypothetical protein